MSTPESSSNSSPSTPPPSMATIKERMRSTWMSGDYSKIAAIVAGSAEEFVKRLALKPGVRALDVACGTGNVTIPMAKVGAVVTGVDIAPNLLAEAKERAAAEGLEISFDEGDAEKLPYPDASFDVVVSMFGAMFAPQPELVVAELARVLRPGGTLAMANWTPGSFTAKILKTTAKYVPPTAGIDSPLLWGDEKTVRGRLASGFKDIQTETVPIQFDLPMSPLQSSALFRRYYGPLKTALEKLDTDGQGRLGTELDGLWPSAGLAPTTAPGHAKDGLWPSAGLAAPAKTESPGEDAPLQLAAEETSGAGITPPTGTSTIVDNEYLQIIATRAA